MTINICVTCAVEVIGMICVSLESQRVPINPRIKFLRALVSFIQNSPPHLAEHFLQMGPEPPSSLYLVAQSLQTALPPILENPTSETGLSHLNYIEINVLESKKKSFWSSYLSQVRHCGCQLEPRAFITLPSMIKSEHLAQQDAKSTWKSCLQYFLPSNSKNVPSYKKYFPVHIKWYSSFHHLEWLKTLCTHKASCMIQVTIRIDKF